MKRSLSKLRDDSDSEADDDTDGIRALQEKWQGEKRTLESSLHRLRGTSMNPFPLDFGPELKKDPLGAILIDDLEASWGKLSGNTPTFEITRDAGAILGEILLDVQGSSEMHWQAALKMLWPRASDTVFATAEAAGLGWGASPRALLPLFLSPSSETKALLGRHADLRAHLVAFCVYRTFIQKAKRCIRQIDGAVGALVQDLLCKRCDGWTPSEHDGDRVSWLLFELDSGMIIRGVQCKVANRLSKVTSNSTLQFNMGQGKSSVIFPIILLNASSPQGSSVGRLTVLHSLFDSNYDELRMMMGGLLGRTVCTFPFERNTPVSSGVLDIMLKQLSKCADKGSIVLAVPDHILSFKLMHTEQLHKKDPKNICAQLRGILEYTEQHVMDLLGESDELLRPHYSLVYAMGSRQPLAGGAMRCEVLMAVMEAVQDVVDEHSASWGPGYIELGHSSQADNGCWRQVRLISDEDEEKKEEHEHQQRSKYQNLSRQVLDRLLTNTKDPAVSFLAKLGERARNLIVSFVLNQNKEVYEATLKKELGDEFWDVHGTQCLVLRGLLGYEVLPHVLGKRCNVDYGIDPNRALSLWMAVPFRAKDLPADRAEFGQSDVLIAFTLLSYYEQGLSLSQIVDTLKHMLERDPLVGDLECTYWVEKAGDILPLALRKLQGINLADAAQCREVHRLLQRNMRAVNYWLANFVLPHQTKQFPEKIETSACDLASFVDRKYPLAGASGTNDTRNFLPIETTQIILPELFSTNAQVVLNILRANDNNNDAVMSLGSGPPTSLDVLDKVITCAAKVLLDPGAIMRDLTNREVAHEWLKRDGSAEGVLFFEDNRKHMLDRHGRCLELLKSPLRERLAHCRVYLDDSHTRGTDIKLPRPMHAACR